MIKESIATGKTLEEAKEKALAALGNYDTEEIGFEVLTQPKAKTFGIFGGCDAKVRVFVEVEDQPEDNATTLNQTKIDKNTNSTDGDTATQAKPVVSAVMDKAHEQMVVNYLKDILENMGVSEIEIDVQVEHDGTKLNFNGKKLGVAIGRKGETLDAIQHLVSLVANKGRDEYYRITLNPGGYRQKREEVLISLAKKSAEKAKRFNKNIMLEAMNSYERRIVHNAVQEVEGVLSWSVGENDNRRVIIGTSKDNKPLRQNYSKGRQNRNHKGGYNKGGYNKGGYNRSRRPANAKYQPKPSVDRAPKSDNNDLPLYGVINK